MCDGGQDSASWDAVRKYAGKFSWVRGINLAKRGGQHAATLVGLRAAQFDVTVTMDDDLQHPPQEIPILLARLTEDADLVYGCPRKNPEGGSRRLTSYAIREVIRHLHGVRHVHSITAFRAIRTHLRDRFRNPDASFVFLDLVLAWVTDRIASVPVTFERRLTGKSGYGFIRRLSLAFTLIATYSPHSLRLIFTLAVGWLTFATAVLVYGCLVHFVPAFRSAASPSLQSLVLTSGLMLQLLVLLSIGGLLAKIYIASLGLPQAIIGETVNVAAPPPGKQDD